jgi:hypothetical protein
MKRLFTFGCSFTDYRWPTWADIVAREYDHFENWGKSAGGNHFIFNSLVECNQRNTFTKNDTVMICWSNVTREDRYLTDSWLSAGNIFTTAVYPKTWVNEFVTERGCLIRDLAFIKAIDSILKNVGCNYKFFSIVPIEYNMVDKNQSEHPDVIELYSDVLDKISPSYFEIIFNYDWTSRKSNFSKKLIESKNKEFKKRYDICAGPDWPTFDQACNVDWYKIHNNGILNEIKDLFPFDFFEVKRDYHPTPVEHLEYLQKVAPEIAISSDTVDWVNSYKLDDNFKFAHNQRIERL